MYLSFIVYPQILCRSINFLKHFNISSNLCDSYFSWLTSFQRFLFQSIKHFTLSLFSHRFFSPQSFFFSTSNTGPVLSQASCRVSVISLEISSTTLRILICVRYPVTWIPYLSYSWCISLLWLITTSNSSFLSFFFFF